jgi:hypothetical protein
LLILAIVSDSNLLDWEFLCLAFYFFFVKYFSFIVCYKIISCKILPCVILPYVKLPYLTLFIFCNTFFLVPLSFSSSPLSYIYISLSHGLKWILLIVERIFVRKHSPVLYYVKKYINNTNKKKKIMTFTQFKDTE